MIESFFGVHPYVIRSGLWQRMKPGERDLYIYLMSESERCCTRELTAPDAQIKGLVGVAPRTLCNARKKLQELGLIRFTAGTGNRYRYVICNPQTGEPYLGNPRKPVRLAKKNHSGDKSVAAPNSSPAHGPNNSADQQNMPIRIQGVQGIFS